MRTTILTSFLCLCLVVSGWTAEFQPLFDGESLNGWMNPFDHGKAEVVDGEIHLTGHPKFFLVTENTYGDFILEVDVNVPVGGNSGIQFRCHYEKNNNVKTKLWGYQAEVDTKPRKWSGGLYDEGRRKWLNPLEGQSKKQNAFNNGEWNTYRIEANGDHIRIFVNDILTTDYRDPVDLTGHIALQHHGEEGLTYRFRNIRLKDLGRHEWKPIFDGESLDGWHTQPGGEWKVEDGKIVGLSDADEKRHGLLVTDKVFDDFTARVQFKCIEGNSGFYFRIDEIPKGVHAHGFQAEIENSNAVGGLYETGGRAWVATPNEEEIANHYKPKEWNEMVVSAHGPRIVVHVNGYKAVEIHDEEGRKKGKLALQLHGGQDMYVEFKDISILEDF